MRTLSTFLFIAIFGIESYNTHVAIAHSTIGAVHPIQITGQKQHSRSLRQYIANESSSDKEERGAVDKVDDIVTKLDGAVDKAKLITPKLDYMIMKNLGEFSREALVQKLSSKYSGAAKLSYSTLKQLDEVEKLRVGDIATYSKENGRSMHKEIPDFVGIKRAPEKYMESHVGREKQLFGEDGSRFLSCGVVLKPMDQGDKMLLISPSNPNKGDWLLPKGGWDEGEEIEVAALREVMEEGGIDAQLAHSLGKMTFEEKRKKYTYHSFVMISKAEYDDWAENVRYRIWIYPKDAIILLSDRPHMVKVVQNAMEILKKVKAGDLPEVNPTLGEIKLDGLT